MKKICLKLNDKTAYFDLFVEDAPVTCERFLKILPQKMDCHYAKFAGQEIFGTIPMMAPIEGGKSLKEIDTDKGCVAFFPDRTFFCIYYGDLQDEEVSITVIGQLEADQDFIDEMEKCRYKQGDFLEIWDPDAEEKAWEPHKFVIDTKMGFEEAPEDVKRVAAKRGIMLPGGPMVNADGETRKLSDFVWKLYCSEVEGVEYGDKFVADMLDYYAFKIGGWCGLTDSADDIKKYKDLLFSGDMPREDVLLDFLYYANQLSMWVDIEIPWEEITQIMSK